MLENIFDRYSWGKEIGKENICQMQIQPSIC